MREDGLMENQRARCGFMERAKAIEVQVEMESRHCKGCGMKFRVLSTSKQKFHSNQCEQLGAKYKGETIGERETVTVQSGRTSPRIHPEGEPDGTPSGFPSREDRLKRQDHKKNVGSVTWDERQKELKTANAERERGTNGGTTMSQVLENEKLRETKNVGTLVPSRTGNTQETTTTAISRSALPDVKSGHVETKSDSSPLNAPTIMPTANNNWPASSPSEEETVQPSASGKQSTSVELVESQSMNLLDDTAKHLHALMRGLHANKPEPEIQAYDPDRVNAACNCAKNIREIMKLKLEAIKLQLENR